MNKFVCLKELETSRLYIAIYEKKDNFCINDIIINDNIKYVVLGFSKTVEDAIKLNETLEGRN